MKRVSNAYKQAMAKKIRDHAYMVVSVGVISNEAQYSAKVTSDTLYISDNNDLFKDREITHTYATLENNVFKANGSQIFVPESTVIYQLASIVACVSENVMGNITVQFNNSYDIKGITLDFGEFYPTEFNIIVNGDTTFNYSNSNEIFTSEDNYDSANTITIQPIHFVNGDNKRLRIESMLMGIGIIFDNSTIESATLVDTTSFISENLPQLDFTVICFDVDKKFNVDDTNSFINYLEAGQAINSTLGVELADGSIEWVEMPITYITEWSSNNTKVTFNTCDRIALFTTKYENGNYIHTRTLYDDALAIFTFLGLEPDEYYIDDVLRNVTVTNPLPLVSCAECLQLIANAGRCALKQDNNGRVVFIPNFENIVDPTDLTVETDSQASWSKPDNIRTGSNIIYSDMTNDFFSADGSMYFLPESGSTYLETGFVSSAIADNNGDFSTNPKLSLILPAAYTYFGIHFEFGGNAPQKFTLKTYKSNSLVASFNVNVTGNDYTFTDALYNFDKVEFEFTKGSSNDRVVLQKVSFGNLTSYRLIRQDMKKNPIGTVEPKTKSVSVKIFTFEETTTNGVTTPKVVTDDVYYTETINPIGEVVTFENQLISTQAHAQEVAKWLANFYANNVSYQVNYRGEPILESLDYIYMDSEVLNNLLVEIETHTLNFNGALSGTLELRRAANMINA